MKCVDEKKYLGQIISKDLKNEKNLKDKTNNAVGNVNKIISTLNERPFGKYTFQGAKLMREGILIGSLLNNAETWINLTQKNLLELEKPDKMLQEILFETKSSKVFYYLEFGILPAKYVIMKKRLKFLKYILDEPMETMIRQVFEENKKDSRKGDLINMITEDLKVLDLGLKEKDIETYTKSAWNKLVNKKIEKAAFDRLICENATKSKTKHIKYEQL